MRATALHVPSPIFSRTTIETVSEPDVPTGSNEKSRYSLFSEDWTTKNKPFERRPLIGTSFQQIVLISPRAFLNKQGPYYYHGSRERLTALNTLDQCDASVQNIVRRGSNSRHDHSLSLSRLCYHIVHGRKLHVVQTGKNPNKLLPVQSRHAKKYRKEK